jgi:hypothetical protein
MFGVILPELIDILEGMLFLVKFTRAKKQVKLKTYSDQLLQYYEPITIYMEKLYFALLCSN